MIVFANPLQPLIDVAQAILVFFHDTGGFGWGMAIIALTVITRIALLPLTLKQSKSMRELQKITPEMKKLQEKYGDDKQRLNQEMMKLYQEHSVNPLGSCLPLLAQLPIFLALFYSLREDLRNDICGQEKEPCSDVLSPGNPEQFWFIDDLTDKAAGEVLIVLIVLYIGTQLVSSLLMTVTADKNQRYIMLALPFVFSVFIISFPTGLIVYWITTNLWTIVQQQIVKWRLGPVVRPEVAAATAGGKAGIAGGSAAEGDSGSGDGKDSSGGLLGRLAGRQAETAPPPPPAAKPPPPPRKKKKRSGRRR